MTDRTTYAGYLHDFTLGGTILSLNKENNSVQLLSVANPLLKKDGDLRKETIYISQKTQIWVDGKPLARNLYFGKLKVGMHLNVAIRYEEYENVDHITAHSIFDVESFLSYAKSELLNDKGLFRHFTPKMSKYD